MTDLQIAFIITASLTGLLLLFIIFYRPVKRAILRRHYVWFFARYIYRIALDFDYYLINQFAYIHSNREEKTINHILFGSKWIYVITDGYYPGAISAKENDVSWIYYSSRKKKAYIDNPLRINADNVNQISMITDVNKDLLISIVVINDDCHVEPFDGTSKTNFLVKKSQLRHLIKALEGRDVDNIDEKALAKAVTEIHALNRNKKK
ncbi:MAG: hypothetical protein WC160_01635 [Bacilli bacterium]|jgi:hypothetical protein|nr:hypothetical protein [Bacilli bacterium]MDD4303672.1 hypothetical protein [Bacilli bacterium]HOH68399.1 hypothetical protein [Bacilli bacterium]HPY38501.1 hypothetical protein [Bacilli bacterium]HQC32888.1 hypothetical protein [Bacilli bacterium]